MSRLLKLPADKFGRNLRRARIAAGLTAIDASKALGISAQALYNYELGRRNLDNNKIGKIAELYGVSIDSLIYSDEDFENINYPDYTADFVNPNLLGFLGDIPVLYMNSQWGVIDGKAQLIRLSNGKLLHFEEIKPETLRTFIGLGKLLTLDEIKKRKGQKIEVWVHSYPMVNGQYTVRDYDAINANDNIVAFSGYNVKWIAFAPKETFQPPKD